MQPSLKRASAAQRQWNALSPTGDFAALVERVVAIIEEARSRVIRTVNSEMVLSYWHIGREIVEYVQRGESRGEYGEQVFEDLSAQLLARVGRGYSTRNLWYFRDFYLTYRERAPSIRAEVFRTSLVQNSGPIDAAKILHEAGAEFAHGVNPRVIRVQDMRRKWGSCSSAGTVTLASDLVEQDQRFQDFVIAHELLRLRVPTHGRLYKALMSAHVPGWRELEEQRGMARLNCGKGAL